MKMVRNVLAEAAGWMGIITYYVGGFTLIAVFLFPVGIYLYGFLSMLGGNHPCGGTGSNCRVFLATICVGGLGGYLMAGDAEPVTIDKIEPKGTQYRFRPRKSARQFPIFLKFLGWVLTIVFWIILVDHYISNLSQWYSC